MTNYVTSTPLPHQSSPLHASQPVGHMLGSSAGQRDAWWQNGGGLGLVRSAVDVRARRSVLLATRHRSEKTSRDRRLGVF